MPGGQHRAEKVEIWPSPSCAGRGAHLPAIFTSPWAPKQPAGGPAHHLHGQPVAP